MAPFFPLSRRFRAVFGMLLSISLVFGGDGYFSDPAFAAISKGPVTRIITDYQDGDSPIWDSASFTNPIDSEANLLAFTWDGTVFSTGVDDDALSGAFTAQTWRALEPDSLPTNPGHADNDYYLFRGGGDTQSEAYVGPGRAFEAGDLDSDASGEDLADLLSDGIQGLDISTGLTNIPASSSVEFPINSIDSGSVGDGIPDILITQIFGPSSTAFDTFSLKDDSDPSFGKELAINLNITSVADDSSFGRYDKHNFVEDDNSPRSLDLRLYAFDFSELLNVGETASDADALVWEPSGSSDTAFFAYNTASFSLLPQTISFGALEDAVLSDSVDALAATSSSGLAVSFASTTASVCTVSGTSVTLVDEGTCSITATQGGNTQYDAAADVTRSFEVVRLSQTVSWPQSTALELADSGVAATPASSSGNGSISYSLVSAGATGCAINSSTGVITFNSTGSCSVKATSAETDTYSEASKTVAITVSRGTFAITAPSSKVGASSSEFTDVCDSSCDVTGFAAADTVRVVVSKSDGSALSGEVKLTSVADLTQSLDGYQSDATATGLNELAFTGTQAQVNAALETLQYKSPTGGGDETVGISASLDGAAYFSGTGHYYKEVTGGAISWSSARDAAAASSFNGLTGYLVTVTSAEENAFVKSKTSVNSWLGASDNATELNSILGADTFSSQDDAEGNWYWVTGPEAGTKFWDEPSADMSANDGRVSADGSYRYHNWNNSLFDGSGGEPNDYRTEGTSGEEDYAHIFNSSGLWNDYPESPGSISSYVIEYGGNGGTVLKQASTTFDVGAPTAPLQVSGVSVSAGNTQLTVSWSAPGTGGSAITDYVIEQSTDGGATWTTLSDGTSTSTSYTVTGLTNGSSYSFRVSAKNAIGTGTASSTASGTPAVPAATSTSRSNDDDEPVVTPVVTPTVTRPTVRLPFSTPTPPRPTVLSAPVKTSTSVSTPFDRLVSRVGGVPAPVSTSSSGDDELSVSTSSLRLSLKMSQPGTVSTLSDDVAPELTIKPGARAAVTGSGLLPNTTLQVWLPNVSERELGRLSVNADGEIQGELGLSSSLGEDPLPVGRQTLQMTGYDADGNQTVVEMPVNIAQGPPTPEPNREVSALPDLSLGQSLATSAGVPTTVVVTPFSDQRVVAVDGGDWSLSVALEDQNGEVGGTSESPLIRMTQSGQGVVTGDGFQPGTVASLWMFSEPTLLGTVTVAEDGSFDAQFLVDAQFIPAGEHTLQIQGVGTDGYIKAANLGVLVDAAPVETTADSALTLIWWVLAGLLLIALLMVLVVTLRRRQA